MEDKLIIKYIKKRKEKGLELLIDTYGGLIKSVINRYLFNINGYESECMDDVLLSIWNNIDKFNGKENSFKNWVVVIAKYRAIDYKRKYLKIVKQEDEIDAGVLDTSVAIDKEILEEDLKNDIEKLLDNLSEKDKELFMKLFIYEEDIDNVAEELKISKANIYNRVSRGRNKLKKIVTINEFY
ncbi:MAG: sigma-70 family RNA polymerase sigma factor [Clostridium sp.]